MALAGARRPEEERVFALLDEAGGGELVDQHAIHLLVEIEIEAVERAVGIAEAGELVASGQETVFASLQFVGDERGDEIERREPFGLGMPQSGFEDVGHAGESELAERTIQFDEIHSEPPVF